MNAATPPGAWGRSVISLAHTVRPPEDASLYIDILGDWGRNLNPALSMIGRMLLPHRLEHGMKSFEGLHATPSHTPSSTIKASIGFGVKKLSHRQLNERLDEQIEGGDPVLLMRYSAAGRVLLDIPTRCSLIKQSLNPPAGATRQSIVYSGPLPDFKSSWLTRVLYPLLRWLIFPFLFTCACWAICTPSYRPVVAHYTYPAFAPANTTAANLSSLLPLNPAVRSGAFQLGQLEYRLTALEGSPPPQNHTAISQVLQAAAAVAKRATVSSAELHATLSYLLEDESHVSLGSRVSGFFSFVNTMWLLGIVGITVSIGCGTFVSQCLVDV